MALLNVDEIKSCMAKKTATRDEKLTNNPKIHSRDIMIKGSMKGIWGVIMSLRPLKMMKHEGLRGSSSSTPNQNNNGTIPTKTVITEDKAKGDNHNGSHIRKKASKGKLEGVTSLWNKHYSPLLR